MKEVRAYIKPHKLGEVTLALHDVKGLTGMTVMDSRGFGRAHSRGRHETGDDAFDFVPCVRIEVVCVDELVDLIIETIQKHAHTGLKGDGKIYVYEAQDAVRIGTGERGRDAV
jgi:nitrogen regulatory protein PII